MNAKKIQKDMERWAKAKNRQQAKANPPKVEPEPPQPEAPVVVRFLCFATSKYFTQNIFMKSIIFIISRNHSNIYKHP